VIRQTHLIAVVGAFLIGCAVLLLVGGCAGVRSQARKEEQAHTEATASKEARCEGTRTYKEKGWGVWTTNDVPGCPKGGLLSGTDGHDELDGKDGDDEIHSLGGEDGWIFGGSGSDVIYGGEGSDTLAGGNKWGFPPETSKNVLYGGPGDDDLGGSQGDDVLYGGDGNDLFENDGFTGGEDVYHGGEGDDHIAAVPGWPRDKQRDKLYCGEGKDTYTADKLDYVDSSCEVKQPPSNL
jgi:RTX calcium-binding nonapeptide repeat (4 copies)